MNRPVNNWDVDIDGGWGAGWGCCHYGYGLGAAAVGAAAGYAAAEYYDDDDYYAYPSPVTYGLPADCTTTVVNGVTYQQCGSDYYEPQFSGSEVTYISVNSPQ